MAPTLTFFDSHEPSFTAGDYTIKVEQSVQAGSKSRLEKFATTRQFSVLGPRFTLNPQDIQEMFPPPGSLGEHSNVLPHIILKRSTLPWERSAQDKSDVPWLALLLFEIQEIDKKEITEIDKNKIQERSLMLNQLRQEKFFPKLMKKGINGLIEGLQEGDHDGDQVTVIDVPRGILEQLIPTTEELKYLAHVRQTEHTKEEVAVVIGNRLPASGKMSIVHLVSLEDRYSGGKFDYKDAKSDDKIPLVSLKSWRFACVSTKQSFKGLLTHLNHQLLFHFPPKVTETLIKALNAGSIPGDVDSAFARSARPLTKKAAVSEHSQWRISDTGNRSYLVSKNRNVFNQAGKKLFTLDTVPDGQKLSNAVRESFAKAGHRLNDKATLEQDDHWWIEDGGNQYFISQEQKTLYVYDLDPDRSSTLRLPPSANKQVEPSANKQAEEYLKRGCVALPHAMRHGKQTVSWYHGPLTPGKTTPDDVKWPIQSADALLRYDEQVGMLDVSYAAAWELGRLLTLQKTQVAVDLFNWKRAHAHDTHVQEAHKAETQKKSPGVTAALAYLPYEKAKTDVALPQTVTKWFDDLACFRGVPFSYLVPDERMLPLESIRFFWVDRRWIDCLLDGAFSIGRATGKDHERDVTHVENTAKSLFQTSHNTVTGFLLRSDVVSGWPGLLVDGHANRTPLKLLCMERLSKNVLLCLFDGDVTAVDIHQKPETLHFGFNRPEPGSDFYKEKTDKTGKPIPITWRDKKKRVVNIGTLAGKDYLASGHSAQFASDMIEGLERVRFQRR
jgi:hypothetical protein